MPTLIRLLSTLASGLLVAATPIQQDRPAELGGSADLDPLHVGPHVFHRRLLANGLRAVAVRDDGETVSVFMVVGVGNRQETPETTGLAHLTEHAMFSGTRVTGVDEHERTVEGCGGESNAFTRQDYTLYYDHAFSPECLGAVLAMEADRLRSLAFDEAAVVHERDRLAVEEARTFQAADGRDEALEAAVFRVHPYRAGVRDEAGHTRAPALGVAAIRAFYDRYYHPNMVCVVVVGPLAPDEALGAIEAAFGPLAAGPEPTAVPVEPWVEAAREERIPSVLPRDRIELAWLVPERGDPARPALAVLTHWLDRQELPGGIPVAATLGGRIDRDLLRLGASGEGVRAALGELAARARTAAPGAPELAEVKRLLRDEFAGLPLRARPYFSLAATFGVFEVAGQAGLVAGREAAIDAVTAADVLAVAQRFLDPARCVTVIFEGTGAEVEPLPDEPAALAAAARDASDAGDFDRARAAYTRLLELGPNRMNQVIYRASRGQIAMEVRDYDAAIADYEAALAVIDYPAVRDLLEEAHARKAAAMRGEFGADEEGDAPVAADEGDAPVAADEGDAGADSEDSAGAGTGDQPAGDDERAEMEQELLRQVAAARIELEHWRGLRFTIPVEPEFVDTAPDEKLGGWYEPDTGRLVVVLGKGAGFARGAQLHELFHALQDQAWDLSVLHGTATTTDEEHALQGLIEGEAMLAVSELLDYDFEQHARIPDEGEVDRARFEKIFHYGMGLRFVRALRDAEPGGWAAVNRAWGRPPRSTAELFHPERYPAEMIPFAPSERDGVVETDVRGEFELRWLLVQEPVTRALAAALGAALVADVWQLVEVAGGGRREVWRLRFAGERAAQRFIEEGEPAWRREGWSGVRAGADVVLERPARS